MTPPAGPTPATIGVRVARRGHTWVGRMPEQSHLESWHTLTADRLAREAGTTPEYIARLAEAGVIRADADGQFTTHDGTTDARHRDAPGRERRRRALEM